MKEIRIRLECYDLEALLERTVHFLKEQVSSEVGTTYEIVWVQSLGDVPIFGPEIGWDVVSALKKKRRKVFFPFAYADADGTFTCADGHTYKQASDDEYSDDEMFIGMEDSLGYLVQITGRSVIINSAIHAGGGCCGPAARVDVYPNCGVLEQPMEKFIRRFIRV